MILVILFIMVNFLILVNLVDLVSLVILVNHLVITWGGGVNLVNVENHWGFLWFG